MSADTALRFGHWFGVEAQFWLNLQTQFDLVFAEQNVGEAGAEPAHSSTRLTQRPPPPHASHQPPRDQARLLHDATEHNILRGTPGGSLGSLAGDVRSPRPPWRRSSGLTDSRQADSRDHQQCHQSDVPLEAPRRCGHLVSRLMSRDASTLSQLAMWWMT